MKNIQKLCLTVLILLITSSITIRIKQDKFEWATISTKNFDNKTNVKLIYLKNKMSQTNINDIISAIPKPLKVASTDIFVVNTEGVYWFINKGTSDSRGDVKTSGGLLGGIWELAKSQTASNTVIYSVRPENKANMLFNNEGMTLIGEYSNGDGTSNTKINWGLSETKGASETSNSGKLIEANDGGIYAGSGLKVEFKGTITNQLAKASNGSVSQSSKVDNFASKTDTDPSGENGSASYTLTWRIAADKPELAFQITLNTVQGKMPISTARVDLNYNGKIKSVSAVNPSNSVDVAYEAVAAPELMIGNASTNLSNVDVNKYFTNSCVKSLFNYEFKETKKAFSVKTPPGRGQVLCLGAPVHKISFLCAYPNNDNLPKEAYEDYSMTLTEDKVSDSVRKITLSYNLLKTRPIELDSSRYVSLGMRIKVIDATPALA